MAAALIARAEIRGMEALYIEAMDELLAKDLAFFHDNFAGSLTKRTLGYARRFEDVFDVLVVPGHREHPAAGVRRRGALALLAAVHRGPVGDAALTAALVVPRIRRRQRLVDDREAASNVLAGHVADSIANAEAVRAFAREPEEAAIHAANVGTSEEDAAVMGLPEPPRGHDHGADVRADEHARPDRRARTSVTAPASSLEAVFLTFSYFAAATRVMWEFNRIYRNLEGALTDAAQFAELLLDPPSVADAARPQPFAPRDYGVEVRDIDFRHSPAQPLLFDGSRYRRGRGRSSGSSGAPAAARPR